MARPAICTRMYNPRNIVIGPKFRPMPRVAIGSEPVEDDWMTPREARAFAMAVLRSADSIEASAARARARRRTGGQ